jgi:L-Ala-D/L-Glu epimerase
MDLQLRVVTLHLKEPFTVSRESYQAHDSVIVALGDRGQTGYGEATQFAVYGATVAGIETALRAIEAVLRERDFTTPDALWAALAPRLGHEPFAQCALDVAAHDLWGRLQGRPLHALWGLDPAAAPPSVHSVGIAPVDEMIVKVQELAGWPVLKIKVGTPDDLGMLRALRRHTSAAFRIDANCGWTVQRTLDLAPALAELGVELIEQPLPRDDWDGMRVLFERSPLPLIADESCAAEADLERCHRHFHGVNIKLTKCGGITPALRIIARARELGMTIMIGCLPESSVGASAIAQLAPLLDAVDMDSIMFLADDVARGATLDHGRIVLPDGPGTGVRLVR